MINAINTENESFKDYNFHTDNKTIIQNLSKVNIFIGENNSGKSRFLRGLFGVKNLLFEDDTVPISQIKKILETFKLEFENTFIENLNEKKYFENFKNNFYGNLDLDTFISAKNHKTIPTNFSTRISTFSDMVQNVELADYGVPYIQHSLLREKLLRVTLDLHIKINTILKDVSFEQFPNRYYIPILRTMRDLNSSSEAYIKTIKADYFEEPNEAKNIENNIFTGQNLYSQILHQKNSDLETDRENFSDFQTFIHETFFKSKTKFEIISVSGKNGIIKINFGKNDEFAIPHLGDGIQALILLLYPIFMKQGENALFFIEEPELNLHPGMQRVFMEALLNDRFKNMQFFFTTHSNHFLDLTLETNKISVYHFDKTNNRKFEVKNTVHGEVNILKSLGIRNSSIFLSNCTIWVEGITDRKYIKKYLELYWKENKPKKLYLEDLNYSFVEYAGSNIVHWNFDKDNKDENIDALKINNNIFLIIDSDITEKGECSKEERQKKLKTVLGDKLYITEGKEIENSLSFDVIKKVVAEYEGVDLANLLLKKIKTNSIKSKSHNSDAEIEKPFFWKENIGKIIDSSLLTKKRKAAYADNNTIRDKDAFCDKAINHLKSYNDLSEEAKELCKKLSDFIESCNK